MALNRKHGTVLFSIGALLVGIGLGWLFFAPSKPKVGGAIIAGKDCTTSDGKKGKTDSTGVCKA